MPSVGENVKIPLTYSKSGHFIFNLFPVTKAESFDAAQCLLVNKSWTKDSANRAVSYIANTDEKDVKLEPFTRNNVKMKIKEGRAKLTKEDVKKLHHVFGHAGRDKLAALIKKADRWSPEVESHLDELQKCEVCKLESKLVPRPKVAYPRASQHNHILAVDLKENTRFPNSHPYIFYMVDCFTRFKMACFIPNKKAQTIAETLFSHWIKLFGPPQFLHSDRGREFVNDEVQKLCELHGIRVTNTAAHTPNANGLCEKQHWWVDKMMEKLSIVDPNCSPEILLGWCIHAANTLDMKSGFSPHMLVFGKNPTHPSLAYPNPTMSSNPEFSKVLSDNINMMYKAREAYIQCESDNVIREALKQRIYAKIENINLQDWIYFKESNRWSGPVRVVGIEGKRIHAIRAGRLLTINKDNVILSKSQEEVSVIGDQFTTLPEHLKPQLEEERISFENTPVTKNSEETIDEMDVIETVQEPEANNDEIVQTVPTSRCKTCQQIFPTDEVVAHAKSEHNISGNVRQVSTMTQKVFFTSLNDEQIEECFIVTLPRSEHNKPHAVKAKKKELENFDEFDVYDVVNTPGKGTILPTQWVLVQKEDESGQLHTKARLCIRGDLEPNKHLIPTDSPTINKITLKTILTVAASKGWSLQTSDITRAFLQTEDLQREIFVKPPHEANVPEGKFWRLKKCCYGLIDAGRSFFLKHGNELNKLGMETLKMDPACSLYFTDKSKITSEHRDLKGTIGTHVDDTIGLGSHELFENVIDEMKQKFKYGSHNSPPFKYTGLAVNVSNDGIKIDQDKYIDELEVPNLKNLAHMTKDTILDSDHQTLFRSLTSKLNMLSITARPDIAFEVKLLSSKYGKATKDDLQNVIKLVRKVKRDTTEFVIPNIGPMEEWLLVGISDAATKKINNLFSVSGQIVMLVNKFTNKASVLFWASKKIERVVSSSLAAEALALQKLFSTMHYVRQILNQMFGTSAKNIPGLALIDNQDLWSTLHHIKNCEDKRLLSDIIQLKQGIVIDHTVQEVRYVSSKEMLSDCLTKQGKSAEAFNIVLKSGEYKIPGGCEIRDSTKINVSTWKQLIEAETEDFN